MSYASSSSRLDRYPACDSDALERILVASLGLAAGWLAVASGGVLLARRIVGGVTAAPGVVTLTAICGAGLLLVAVADQAARYTGGRESLLARIGFLMAVLATTLPLPLGRPAAMAATVGAIIVTLAVVLQPWAGRWLSNRSRRSSRLVGGSAERASFPTVVMDEHEMAVSQRSLPLATPDEHVLQQQDRFIRSDGSECVRGRLFLAVSTGARAVSGHIGFCPPFATNPTVDVTTAYDEMEAIVAAAEVLPWGVRVECRLDEPADEPFEIPIDIFATAAPPPPFSAHGES